MGDPHGVGPEVVLRSVVRLDHLNRSRVLVVGDPDFLQQLSDDLGLGDLSDLSFSVPGKFPFPPRWGKLSAEAGGFAFSCLKTALDEVIGREAPLLVTAPIHKQAAALAGFQYPGQTEFIASYFPGCEAGMVFLSDPLKLILVTVHMSLRDALDNLSTEGVLRSGRLLHGMLRRIGYARPRLAVAGLNPHASESGRFGNEEERILEPAVKELRALFGIDSVDGPLPPDTLFYRAVNGEFDGVVSLYHDQGLIPLKLVAFRTAVNVTAGLPIVRTSPSHGTAFDIAGQGRADSSSMDAAFRWGLQLVSCRGD